MLLGVMTLGASHLVGQTLRPPIRVEGRVGDVVSLSASAEGDRPFTYQWRRDGRAIAGATDAVLTLPLFQPSDTGTYDVIVKNTLGSAGSDPLTLVISPLPASPSSASAEIGGTAAFSVAPLSRSDTSVTFQWRRNGVNLEGSTNATLNLVNVTERDFGSYTALVTSGSWQFVTAPAQLNRGGAEAVAPVITSQPLDVTLKSGPDSEFSSTPLALSVAASGTPLPRFQWRLDGIDLVGATGETLLIESARKGSYSVVVSNPAGSVASRTAVVQTGSGSARLRNLASQGEVTEQAGEQTLGFYIMGSSPKRLLVRAVGPTLGVFGVPDTLADPVLELYNASENLIVRNDNWGSTTTQAATVRVEAVTAGAFALAEGSADAAVVVSLNPGAHTIKTVGNGKATGHVLTELYDLDDAKASGSRLVNLSRRDSIRRTDDILVSGFAVEGNAAKSVLVRAIGPTLKILGVPSAVARPQLKIYNAANQVVASSVAWESAGISEALNSLSARAGAFPLPRGSADSSLVATLPPGSYTVQVTATGNDTGEVLFEVYEVP